MPQYLNILLQKNDVNLKWGFEVAGGGRTGVPLIITKIHPNSFCSQYLSPEDRIIRIEGIDVELLSEAEAVSFIKKPGRSLNLLIHKHAPTVCRQHNAGDDSSSESSSSSSSTALRHANVRSSFRSYFEHKCNPSQHDPIVSSPTSTPNESSRNAYYSPSSPRVTTKWTRESTTAAPANAESRPNHVSWWDTGASSSSYSPSTLEDDSENDRSHEDNRLRADDKVDAGDKWGRHTDMTFSSSRMVNMGDTNDAVTVNSSGKGKLTEATTTATANFGHYKNNLQSKSRKAFTVRSVRDDGDDKRNVSRVYLSPFGAKINLNDPKASHGFNKIGRQSSQTADTNSPSPAPPPNSICTVPIATNAGIPPPPPAPPTPSSAPMPPPPPPPALNGGAIPTFRLQSEIPERLEPPAKLQNAMMKDKKPFTYTPGGIDLSEIKSPRMARRVMRNAQEPEDIVLPPPTSTPASTASLPPSAYAAMCPQIAIPVFPQNSIGDRKLNHCQRNGHVAQSSPPPPPHRPTTPVSLPSPTPKMVSASTVSPAPPKPASTQNGAVTTDTRPKTAAMTAATNNTSQTQAGSIYVPPVSENDSGKSKPSPPTFPTLREAPTPWLNKHQQQQQPENVPAWRTRNNQKTVTKDAEQEDKLGSVQIKVNIEPNSNQSTNGTRIIPIKIGGAAPKINQSKRWGSAKDNNETVQSSINSTNNNINNNNNNKNKNNNNNNSNNRAAEPESKPIQSRSFKVLQKITGSEDDSTDVPYNSEGVPLSQLRKLHLNDDDQAFMNKVKAQGKFNNDRDAESFTTESNYDDDWVDEDTFLHMETDPRYRGSVIPSRAFRMLQNMTDSGQVTSNNVVVIPVNHTTQNQTMQPHPARSAVDVHTQAPPSQAPPSQQITIQREIETKKNYIPPSERQAEQDLRKYMGSSIPSRSFRMLQAMTATQDSTVRTGETDF